MRATNASLPGDKPIRHPNELIESIFFVGELFNAASESLRVCDPSFLRTALERANELQSNYFHQNESIVRTYPKRTKKIISQLEGLLHNFNTGLNSDNWAESTSDTITKYNNADKLASANQVRFLVSQLELFAHYYIDCPENPEALNSLREFAQLLKDQFDKADSAVSSNNDFNSLKSLTTDLLTTTDDISYNISNAFYLYYQRNPLHRYKRTAPQSVIEPR